MINKRSRDELRRKRHARLRLRIEGTPQRPRLSVFRSAKFIYAQVIDDTTGRTLAAASSRESGLDGERALCPGVADIAHSAQVERRDSARLIVLSHQAGLVTNLARPMAGTWTPSTIPSRRGSERRWQ